ncbi:MAG: N-acetyltransferase [Chloroflexi bacterium]|nr:N-acetyltransferase [Chloroflexota bacterium]
MAAERVAVDFSASGASGASGANGRAATGDVRVSAAPAVGAVRPATRADIPAMQALINGFAAQNRMLFRSAEELEEFLDEYHVHEEDGRVLGVCGLHPVAGALAEVRGLAVSEHAAGHGIGRRLVEACVARARALGIAKVYTLTLVPGFFEKLGFCQVDKGTLHIKVWYECYRCPKFARCDEIAMVRPLDLEELR